MSTSFSKLSVGDEDFLVASMIERAPKILMVRELLMNALEAAGSAPAGSRKVEVTAARVDGVRKLRFWNSGTGMTADQLFRMCDIASSIGKQHGLDRNFGMGAKVASLPSNQLGLRYRSCHAGRVHEVMLGKRDGLYGRVPLVDPATGKTGFVVDATAAAQADGLSTDSDWTEVVLLGNTPEQDTVADPYAGNPAMSRNWVPTTIYNKFFEIGEGIDLILSPDVHHLRGERRLVPLKDRIASHYGQHEAVALPDGIRIEYLYDPPHPTRPGSNASYEDGLVHDTSFCAIVHGGELYDMRRGLAWTLEAPAYGVTFGARHISVLVHLSDDFPVRVDGYRQFLRYVAGVQDHVRASDFAGMIRENRPAWLIELIASMSPDVDLSRDVSDQLAKLLRMLGIKRTRLRARRPIMPRAMSAERQAELAGRAEARPPRQAEDRPRNEQPPKELPPGTPTEQVLDVEDAPEILVLREPQEIADRNLTYRAARYYPESHQLYINMAYPSVQRQVEMLVQAAPSSTPPELVKAEAVAAAEQDLLLRVGRALVFGLGKRDAASGWNEVDKRAATSSETLTIAAEDIYGGKAELLAGFQARLSRSAA
ncbi:ATP-binding protein [Roseomonas populi]|uniref:ATP-binding protein n=1 Tax=Roseomonas populi TaxID=3121582 RepID=A0ABT1XBK2_9PROT|nr:ATP-binding protein [Roseomonas pecuniae]MCR0985126.1 ATP-binding protein [Roseomonas pecuniae]